MKNGTVKAIALLCLSAASLGLGGCLAYAKEPPLVERGRQIAERQCASCHAVGMEGESPDPAAPALRDLYRRYSLEDVRLAFSRGVHIGHPDMPIFHLDEAETEGLLAYLTSIDPCAQPSSDRQAMERCFSPL